MVSCGMKFTKYALRAGWGNITIIAPNVLTNLMKAR